MKVRPPCPFHCTCIQHNCRRKMEDDGSSKRLAKQSICTWSVRACSALKPYATTLLPLIIAPTCTLWELEKHLKIWLVDTAYRLLSTWRAKHAIAILWVFHASRSWQGFCHCTSWPLSTWSARHSQELSITTLSASTWSITSSVLKQHEIMLWLHAISKKGLTRELDSGCVPHHAAELLHAITSFHDGTKTLASICLYRRLCDRTTNTKVDITSEP